MKVVKNNQELKLITVYPHNALKDEEEIALSSKHSYMIYYDRETNAVYKANVINMNMHTASAFSLITIALMGYFPNELFPYDSLPLFITLVLVTILVSFRFGYFLSQHSNENLRRIELTKEEWVHYVREGEQTLKSEVIFLVFLKILTLICFILSYIRTSKWGFFGGIGAATLVGVFSAFTSLSRYLLYKNNITPDLTRGENEDETIAHW